MLIPSGVPPFIIFSIFFAGLALIVGLATYADLSYRGMGKTTLGIALPRLFAIPKLQKSIEKRIYQYYWFLFIFFILLMLESQKKVKDYFIWNVSVLDAAYVLLFCYGIFFLIPKMMKDSHNLGIYIKELKEAYNRQVLENVKKISSNIIKLKEN